MMRLFFRRFMRIAVFQTGCCDATRCNLASQPQCRAFLIRTVEAKAQAMRNQWPVTSSLTIRRSAIQEQLTLEFQKMNGTQR
ncbi:hypothetical protein Q31a_40070 [Aureliella helgolandensis]|uniref:Uncharacterized protein n=1 Tax=Aureliella helgolandensis TaxID=2527968 RepID=A0A518GAW7_9BACT|nr:hypothetical protein Q31a_40070 [Aureliella helgolandensis]